MLTDDELEELFMEFFEKEPLDMFGGYQRAKGDVIYYPKGVEDAQKF